MCELEVMGIKRTDKERKGKEKKRREEKDG